LCHEEYDEGVDTSINLEPLTIEDRAEILKALSDANRIEILDMLSSETRCNCHFQEHLDLAANLLSYHLRILRDAGLIVGTKRGRWVDYALSIDAPHRIAASLPQGLRS